MAGLWPVLPAPRGACPARVAVRPCVRSSPPRTRRLTWRTRGSARCTGSSGLGEHPPPPSPRAADRSGRRSLASRTACPPSGCGVWCVSSAIPIENGRKSPKWAPPRGRPATTRKRRFRLWQLPSVSAGFRRRPGLACLAGRVSSSRPPRPPPAFPGRALPCPGRRTPGRGALGGASGEHKAAPWAFPCASFVAAWSRSRRIPRGWPFRPAASWACRADGAPRTAEGRASSASGAGPPPGRNRPGRGRRTIPTPGPGLAETAPPPAESCRAALVVHSLWRRRCGGWWGGAVPPPGPVTSAPPE